MTNEKKKTKQRRAYQQDYTGCNTKIFLTLINQENRKKETTVVQLSWGGLQCQLIRSIVLIVFVLIDAIDSVNLIDSINRIDCINRIDPGILNCNVLELKNNSNDTTNSKKTFWAKKGRMFEVTGIYWHLERFHEVCLRNKQNYLRGNND